MQMVLDIPSTFLSGGKVRYLQTQNQILQSIFVLQKSFQVFLSFVVCVCGFFFYIAVLIFFFIGISYIWIYAIC